MSYQYIWTPTAEPASSKSVVSILFTDNSTVPGASYIISAGSVRITVPTPGRYVARIRNPTSEETASFDVTGRSESAPAALPLGVLWAGFAVRTLRPVGIVALGSSTINGGDQAYDNRFFTKLIQRMQSTLPSGRGSESTVTTSLTKNSNAGIHGYNSGVGGTTSANYLTDQKVTDIGTIQPFAIIHMVGSNDMSIHMHPATYKSNLSKWLDKLDAAITTPHVHIMVHAHRRAGEFNYQWEDYRRQLEGFSVERSNVIFVDTEPAFTAATVPSPDTFNLLKSDNVHLETAGHELMYRLIAESLRLPSGSINITSNTTNATTVSDDTTTVLSDAFSGVDTANILARPFDNLLGGPYARSWVGDAANQIAITNNRLTRGASATAFFAGAQMPIPDYELAVTVSLLPTGADLILAVRRQSATITDAPNDYRLLVNPSGALTLQKRVAGSVITHAGAGTIVGGDRVAIRAKQSVISVWKNGAKVLEVSDGSTMTPGYTGVAGVAAVQGFQLSNLVVSAVL